MTIELPTPSAELLSQIETQTIETNQSEIAAIAAIRKMLTPYAKHNGHIRTAEYERSDSNYHVDREAYYKIAGKRVRALLALDNFTTSHDDQNRGGRGGTRLYLTEQGEWLELRRTGHWTRWQGAAQWWYTDAASQDAIQVEDDFDDRGGSITKLDDDEVAGKYYLDEILKQIGKSMTEMSKKLPARYAHLQERAELAQRVIAAAGEVSA